jgi:hypothetical protein
VKTIRMLQIIGPALAMAISGPAQETLNYGTISVVVADPSGAVIEGAAITARQTDINLTAQGTTDAEGRFRASKGAAHPFSHAGGQLFSRSQ